MTRPGIISDQEYKRMLYKARKKDAEMAQIEHEAGWAAPKACDLATHLRTAISALECAVKVKDWQTVCEGVILIEQAVAQLREQFPGIDSSDRAVASK
jgi:hypothetical protein